QDQPLALAHRAHERSVVPDRLHPFEDVVAAQFVGRHLLGQGHRVEPLLDAAEVEGGERLAGSRRPPQIDDPRHAGREHSLDEFPDGSSVPFHVLSLPRDALGRGTAARSMLRFQTLMVTLTERTLVPWTTDVHKKMP